MPRARATLYIVDASPACERAVMYFQRIVSCYDPAQLDVSIRNLTLEPITDGEFVPAVVPLARVDGRASGVVASDFADRTELVGALAAAGVHPSHAFLPEDDA